MAVNFPVYRKYPHNRTFFKIISEEAFEEINILGKTYSVRNVKAQIMPDRNYIHDMVYNYEKYWKVISEEEYKQAKKHCEEHLERME